jgi:hypothetical protein
MDSQEKLYGNTRANYLHTLMIFKYVNGKLVVTKKTYPTFDAAYRYSQTIICDNIKIYDDKNHLVFSAKGKQPLRNEMKNVLILPFQSYEYASYA